MGFDSWNLSFRRQEPKAIDKFKNKSRLLKEFGPNGVRIYNSFEPSVSADNIRASLSVSNDEFSRIMEFMLSNQMILPESEGFQSPPVSQAPTFQSQAQSAPQGDFNSHPELSANHSVTPMEKTILDAYGEQGLKVYSLIDGHKSARQILEETGVSESKLVEILEFMNKKGIIKLEKPEGAQSPPTQPYAPKSREFASSPFSPPSAQYSRPGVQPAQNHQSQKSQEKSTGFSPMVENTPSPPKSMNIQNSDGTVEVDIPVFANNLSILGKAKVNLLMALKFGKVGTKLIPHINGVKDFVQLSIETELSMHDLDIILGELGKNGLISFRSLERAEIAQRYGDDGLAVYKKFGRDGILIYQLIGKANSLKDIIKKSHIEQERAIDILMFVHSMLGLDMPLDRDMIYRYITKRGE